MRRALLRHHASGPNRFSLATSPARSGVLHNAEKITIRVAEPGDLRAEAHPGVLRMRRSDGTWTAFRPD
jgi:hypothetical protein